MPLRLVVPYASPVFKSKHKSLAQSGCRYCTSRSCSNFVFMMIQVIILDSHLVRVRSRPPPRMLCSLKALLLLLSWTHKKLNSIYPQKTKPNGKGRLPTDSSMEPLIHPQSSDLLPWSIATQKELPIGFVFVYALLSTNKIEKSKLIFFNWKTQMKIKTL